MFTQAGSSNVIFIVSAIYTDFCILLCEDLRQVCSCGGTFQQLVEQRAYAVLKLIL